MTETAWTEARVRLENRVLGEIAVGDRAELSRLCTVDDLYVFAAATGNLNPMHLPDYDIDGDGVPEALAPSAWVAALVSAVIGNFLPGPGTLPRAQRFDFLAPVRVGDELVARVAVAEKLGDGGLRLAATAFRVADGVQILDGEAVVTPPPRKLIYPDLHVPGLIVRRHRHFDALIKAAEPLPPLPVAVVAPEEAKALKGALLAMRHTIIAPVLVGNRSRIEAAARAEGETLEGIEIVEAATPEAAAEAAVDLVVSGRAQGLMKGHLHTDTLLRAVLRKERGLRTGRRLSHVFVMDVPGMAHPLLVTDAAVNIAPDLAAKVDIVQNAIDLALSIGIAEPKVGVLSAVETVNPLIPSSVDAALLSKMAERGQITGGIVEGPLAMDNAVDIAAARTKGLTGPVAGRAEVLVVPGIDAGNMLAKQLTYLAQAEAAGLVIGASVPVILTSRADGEKARLASCAIAALHHARTQGAP